MVRSRFAIAVLFKWFILFIAFFLSVIPFWLLFIASLRKSTVLFEYPPKLWPAEPTLEAYQTILFGNNNFLMWFKNSIIVSCSGTLISIIINLLGAYAFAKKKFPGKTILYFMIMATMIIPGTVTLFPAFQMTKFFGMINTLPGMFIPGVAGAFGLMLIKQFMEGIPDSIIESAVIDGAGNYSVFFRIIIPMTMPAVGILTIWGFMGSWNSLLWPLIIATTEKMRTIPVGIAAMRTQISNSWNLVMASTFLSVVPIFIVFLIFRRNFIEGLTAGSIKG
jgi:ABC-type glycerol-3-phosphate transport system permease component